MLGLEFSIKYGSPVYLAVEGVVVGQTDILLEGVVVQVLLAGGVHRGSFLIEAGNIDEIGLVVHPYSIYGESLQSELIKQGLGRTMKTYPEIWAECVSREGWS